MMRCIVLIAAAASMAWAGGMHARAVEPPNRERIARDLAQAMLVHDQSIRTMRWTQVVRVNSGRPDELLHHSRQVFDDQGRWRCEFEKALFGPDDERVTLRGAMFHDGARLVGRDEGSESGVIRAYSGERTIEPSLDCWLGRNVDVIHGRRLGELLLAADDLELVGQTDRGLPLLAATANITPLVACLEVEVDPEHGFAPRSLTVRDGLIRVPYFRYEVIRFHSVEGVWVPVSGSLESRKFLPTPEQAHKLEEALRERNLGPSNPHDKGVQAGYREVLLQVFGTEEAPSAELVPLVTMEATRIELNVPITTEELQVDHPRSFTVYDAFRDLVKRAHSDEWVENPKGF
jgi:hypothetical protein